MASALPLLGHLVLLLPLLRPSPATAAETYSNITLGTTFTASGPTAYWPSPSGDFAFGFRPLEPDNQSSLFLLAVFFPKTVNQTIVWSANGGTPLPSNSKLLLTADGQLSLRNPAGQEVWNAGTTGASHAAILDTGNLILAGNVEWQSFGSPTDTILPTQVLGLGTQLRSKLTDADYSAGRFILRVQTDGNLVFYQVGLPSGTQYSPYWAGNTVGFGSQLGFSETGDVYFAYSNGTRMNLTSSATNSTTGNFYQRATLDPDGVLRQYLYPKNGTASRSWGDGWTAVAGIPSDICQALSDSTGSGACGFNSYCVQDGNQRPDCRCPPQYSFIDPSHKYKGCKPDFPPQSCTEADDTSDAGLFGFMEVTDADWPLGDYERNANFNEDQCRNNCLNDCFCAVAIFNGGDCRKKRLPLSNGRMGSYVGGKALIKVAKTNNTATAQGGEDKNDRRTLILIGGILLGSSAFLNLLFIVVIFLATTYHKTKRDLSGWSISSINLRAFTYKELDDATRGFSEILGNGAFGTVYKGVLPSTEAGGSYNIAVKKLEKLAEETEKEFTNEVRSIGQTHHKNLVKLFGFCNEGASRLLVYEYMSNGSLDGYLFRDGAPPRPWGNRIGIALGIARGLLYLHEECSSQIIHCDIKPQNILLDDNQAARISDFGLAKLLRTDQTRTTTGIRGTKGYVAPEWFRNMAITAKVDVYSFGVMLLEIVCRRRNLEPEAGSEEEVVLAYWAYDCYRDGRVELLVVGDEEAAADGRRVERLVKVAIWCIQEEPTMRPSIHKVTQMLDGTVEVPVPPDPSSYFSSLP